MFKRKTFGQIGPDHQVLFLHKPKLNKEGHGPFDSINTVSKRRGWWSKLKGGGWNENTMRCAYVLYKKITGIKHTTKEWVGKNIGKIENKIKDVENLLSIIEHEEEERA